MAIQPLRGIATGGIFGFHAASEIRQIRPHPGNADLRELLACEIIGIRFPAGVATIRIRLQATPVRTIEVIARISRPDQLGVAEITAVFGVNQRAIGHPAGPFG